MARTVLPRQWSVPAQLSDFARRITSLEKFVLGLAPRRLALDTGQVLVPITDPNFEPYSINASAPRLRRIGDLVTFDGALRCITAGYMNSGSHDFGVIPVGFRPAGTYGAVILRCQASSSLSWGLQVDENANASRFNGTSDHGTSLWLPFHAMWFTDDAFPSS